MSTFYVYISVYIYTYISGVTNKGTEVVARIFQITSLYLQITELNNAKQVTRFVQETGKLMLHWFVHFLSYRNSPLMTTFGCHCTIRNQGLIKILNEFSMKSWWVFPSISTRRLVLGLADNPQLELAAAELASLAEADKPEKRSWHLTRNRSSCMYDQVSKESFPWAVGMCHHTYVIVIVIVIIIIIIIININMRRYWKGSTCSAWLDNFNSSTTWITATSADLKWKLKEDKFLLILHTVIFQTHPQMTSKWPARISNLKDGSPDQKFLRRLTKGQVNLRGVAESGGMWLLPYGIAKCFSWRILRIPWATTTSFLFGGLNPWEIDSRRRSTARSPRLVSRIRGFFVWRIPSGSWEVVYWL